MLVRLISFGFKHRTVDSLFEDSRNDVAGRQVSKPYIVDCRGISRNPYHVPALNALTGLDQPVIDYVLQDEHAKSLLEQASAHIRHVLETTEPDVIVACGCQGGLHRSVVLVTRLAEIFRAAAPEVRHVELERDAERGTSAGVLDGTLPPSAAPAAAYSKDNAAETVRGPAAGGAASASATPQPSGRGQGSRGSRGSCRGGGPYSSQVQR